MFPKFGADLVYLISDCALFRKYGWLWSHSKPHLGLIVIIIIYLPARTLPLGFGDTPGVPPDVIYQDISPFFIWKSFSNFFALQCAHVYFGLRWSCLTWLHSWRGTSLQTSLATCSHTCRVTGSHCCLGTWWVNLVYPLHLNFKLLDAFFKYSVNQDHPENQDNRYNWDNRDNRDNQDNQVRLAHLWVDFRVIFNVRSMKWFVLGIKRIFDIWGKEGGLQSAKLWRNHFLVVLVEKLSNLADLCNNYRGALLSWDLGALLFLHLQR